MATKKDNDNLRYYEQLRQVPATAIKRINGGRLNGMSDINPVWRIKAMTEAFGICGIGWKYEITQQWVETYGAETKAFTNVNLYVKVDGEWSDAIPGTGGSTLVEAKGYVSDEAYKMSLTDALSVAMKALGVAADVYFAKDARYETKYEAAAKPQPQAQAAKPVAPVDAKALEEAIFDLNENATDRETLKAAWDRHPEFKSNTQFIDTCKRLGEAISQRAAN